MVHQPELDLVIHRERPIRVRNRLPIRPWMGLAPALDLLVSDAGGRSAGAMRRQQLPRDARTPTEFGRERNGPVRGTAGDPSRRNLSTSPTERP